MEKKQIQINIADTSPLLDPEVFKAYYQNATDSRKQKVGLLKFEKDKRLSLAAEALLCRSCENIGIDFRKESVITAPFEKPRFADSSVFFNLSHSGTKVMCVTAPFEVGCDIEKIDDVDLRISERYFHNNEFEMIQNADDKTEVFFRLWVLKESFTKCTGLGFRMPFDGFTVSMNPPGSSGEIKNPVFRAANEKPFFPAANENPFFPAANVNPVSVSANVNPASSSVSRAPVFFTANVKETDTGKNVFIKNGFHDSDYSLRHSVLPENYALAFCVKNQFADFDFSVREILL